MSAASAVSPLLLALPKRRQKARPLPLPRGAVVHANNGIDDSLTFVRSDRVEPLLLFDDNSSAGCVPHGPYKAVVR